MNTIEQALAAYKDELRRYVEWTEDRKKVYGANSSPMESWGGADYRKVERWSSNLTAIERVLGITEAEANQYINEIKKAA